MARAERLARLDERRVELERDYRAALIAALRTTAAGRWGLFDHQGDRHTRAAIAPTLAMLDDLAGEIGDARDRLGLAPFDLHREFLAARGPASSHAVGEPKQAQAWLDRLSPD